jgi:hypothetical protein
LALLIPALLLFGSGWLPSAWTPGGDPTAPSTWTQPQAIAILVGLGVLLLAAWGLVVWTAQQPGGFVVPSALGPIVAAAGMCVTLSGSASGGLIGVPFAGVAAGALLVCVLLARGHAMTGLVGLGAVLLFGLLMGGRFFGELTTTNFALLIAAPLLCGLIAVPPIRDLKPPVRFLAPLVLCLIPAGIAVSLAARSYSAETSETSGYGDAAGWSDAPVFDAAKGGPSRASSALTPSPSKSPRDPGAEEPGRSRSSATKPAPIDPGGDSKN